MAENYRRRGADFESRERFLRHCDIVSASDDSLESSGIPLDYLGDGRYAVTKDEEHTLIIGDTGSGKTRRIIVPSVYLMAATGQSMVLSDPKGEIYQKTAPYLEKRGYDIVVINMREPRNGSRWNPLDRVWSLCRSNDEDERDKGYIQLDGIIDMMASTVHSDKDVFWENIAKQYIRAIAMTIIEYGNEGDLTFNSIAVAEAEISSLLQQRIERRENENNDDEEAEDPFLSFFSSLPPGSDIRQNFQGTACITGSATISSVTSVAHTMTMPYTRHSGVRYLLSGTDFSIEDIGRKKTALYFILPDETATLYPLATMLVAEIYSVLVDSAYKRGGKLDVKVNFILDEFANFPRLENISGMLTAARSRGIRFFLVCQDVDQLEYTYGTYGASIIRSNCLDWVYMGTRNAGFLEMLESLGGTYYERYTHESYPLISVSDLERLEKGEVMVFCHRCSPRLCRLPDYSEVEWKDADEGEKLHPAKNRAVLPPPVDIFRIMRERKKREESGSARERIFDYYKRVFEAGAPFEKDLERVWMELEWSKWKMLEILNQSIEERKGDQDGKM